MNFKKLIICIIFFFHSCTTIELEKSKKNIILEKFENKGFALIYNETLYKDKIISKSLNDRDVLIFQKNLKKGTRVKITNLLNNETIVAKVSSSANYPFFYNSVISKRIAKELNINEAEPYVLIESIAKNFTFVAKKSKMFDEEKNVAGKAPVEEISINDLSNTNKISNSKRIEKKFIYFIKLADFYYVKSAQDLIQRIKNDTNVKNPKLKRISNTQFRVILGPYKNINSLKASFNDISILGFENIEIIKK